MRKEKYIAQERN